MNARKPDRNVTSAFVAGALLAALSFNAVAESTAVLDSRTPVAATLLPSLKVSASISKPSAQVHWSIARKRPLTVTLMPTLTVTATASAVATMTLPTVTVFAEVGPSPIEAAPLLAQAPVFESPLLGVSD